MKNTIIALALVASTVTLTACTQTERGTAIGALPVPSSAVLSPVVPAARSSARQSAVRPAISSPGRTAAATASTATATAAAMKHRLPLNRTCIRNRKRAFRARF